MSQPIRVAIAVAPAVISWIAAAYFTLRAYTQIRRARPGERRFALFFGELGVGLYTFEGHRYKFWAMICWWSGLALTLILLFALHVI